MRGDGHHGEHQRAISIEDRSRAAALSRREERHPKPASEPHTEVTRMSQRLVTFAIPSVTFSSKRTRTLTAFVSLLLGLILALWPKPSSLQTVLSQQQAGSVLAIEKVAAQPDGTVTGEIRNNSKNTVRDVQLFIRYTFLWKNEFHPGKESPSAAFYPTISGEIAPGKSLPFKFMPSPPLPKRTDGRFEAPSVSIAGFTQVIAQSK